MPRGVRRPSMAAVGVRCEACVAPSVASVASVVSVACVRVHPRMATCFFVDKQHATTCVCAAGACASTHHTSGPCAPEHHIPVVSSRLDPKCKRPVMYVCIGGGVTYLYPACPFVLSSLFFSRSSKRSTQYTQKTEDNVDGLVTHRVSVTKKIV